MPRHRKELTGKRFGRLTVTGYAGYGENGRQRVSLWNCKCDCGQQCTVPGYLLQSGRRKSCGCIRTASERLKGMRFGKLTVLSEDMENTTTLRKVICRCDCGREKSIAFRDLKKGKIKSCGCDAVRSLAHADFFEKQYDQILEEKKNAFHRGDTSQIQTLKEWVYVWIREVLPNVVKDNTRIMYGETMERHILPALGEQKLSELSEAVIHQWILRLQKAQIPGTIKGQMTEGTVRNTLSVLSGCLRDAQKYGLIQENPCLSSSWKMPGKNLWESHDWLDEEQITRLETLVMRYQDENGYPAGIAFQLVLYMGMTLSEASALQWKDVDLEQGIIHVRNLVITRRAQVQNISESVLLEAAAGRRRRDIPVPDFLVRRLGNIRENYPCEDNDFVISSSGQNPVTMERMRSVLYRCSQNAGVGRVTPRILRDTYAIRAVQAGATSDMIAELMGFASAQQVVRRYMPKDSADKRVFVNRMYEFLV